MIEVVSFEKIAMFYVFTLRDFPFFVFFTAIRTRFFLSDGFGQILYFCFQELAAHSVFEVQCHPIYF